MWRTASGFLLALLWCTCGCGALEAEEVVPLGDGASPAAVACAVQKTKEKEQLTLLLSQLKALKAEMAMEKRSRQKAEGQVGALKATIKSLKATERNADAKMCPGKLAKALLDLKASQDGAAKASDAAAKQSAWCNQQIKKGQVMKENMRRHMIHNAKSSKVTMDLAGATLYGYATKPSKAVASKVINRFMKHMTEAETKAIRVGNKVNAQQLAAAVAVNAVLKSKIKKLKAGGAKKVTATKAKKVTAKKAIKGAKANPKAAPKKPKE